MRPRYVIFSVFILISAAAFAGAQQQNIWIPRGIESLEGSASSKSGFTFDHSMLVIASKLDSNNEDLRRVIAGVSGISVQNFHFQEPGQYDAALASANDEYRRAGWKQLANEHDKRMLPGVTDFWVRLENDAISNVAILIVKPNEVSFVTVSGSISPLDLSHLGGHFGIPKIEGGVVVPNTSPH